MPEWDGLGKTLLFAGGILVLLGLVMLMMHKGAGTGGSLSEWFGWLGKLPGDIYITRDHFSFYFPLATSILISIVASLLLYLLSKR